MKTLQSYIHLYIGCDVQRDHGGIIEQGKLVGVSASEVESGKTVAIINVDLDHFHEWYIEETVLLLRPLSDMSDEEKKELYAMIFKQPFHSTGNIIWIDDKKPTRSRWVMMTGLDRLGIQMDGTVWADCDLSIIDHNQHEVTRFLLLRHFDLFGLIAAGLAIDKTKLTSTP